MPIKVTCTCGSSFAAKDELAGRTVKCPKCSSPLTIPAAGPTIPAPARAAAPQPQPVGAAAPRPAGLTPPAAPLPSSGSVFDEVGLKQTVAGARMCPGCASPMPPNAIICIKCGYNAKIGRRMETVKTGSGPDGPTGHEATAQDLLNKAALAIEEEKIEEKKKTSEGAPWWLYLGAMVGVVGFMVGMMLLPQQVALATGGVMLYGAAVIISLYAKIRILIMAFSEGMGQGLCVLLIPCYDIIYVFMRWDQCAGYVLMVVAANTVANLVWYCMEAGLLHAEEEKDAYNFRKNPNAAVCIDHDWRPVQLLKSQAVS